MRLKLKRANEPPSKSDGARVLVDRLWPRGQSKEKLRMDAWLKEIAPSDSLREWFGHDPERWDAFRERYARELDGNPHGVQALQELLRAHDAVTLLFGAHDIEHNNAVALVAYMRRRMPRRRTVR